MSIDSQIEFWRGVQLWGGVIAAIIVVFISAFPQWKIQKLEGKLNPSGKIFSAKKKIKPNDTISILVGNNRIRAVAKDLMSSKGKMIKPLQYLGGSEFEIVIKLKSGSLLISTFIRDIDGKLAGELRENDWNPYPGVKDFDMNLDDNGIEVIDPYGIICFQANFIDQKTININGVFVNEGLFFIIDETDSHLFSRGDLNHHGLIKQTKHIKRLFKHPARKYLGQRER